MSLRMAASATGDSMNPDADKTTVRKNVAIMLEQLLFFIVFSLTS
tara:strand:+ start:591 stop:725 length:135 start_codon:yes stop_codon:yes gene_type:complete